MDRTGKRRLLKLADFLDTVKSSRFDITRWFRNYDKDFKALPECKSVACALGWACQIPEFNKYGLHKDGNVPRIFRDGGRHELLGYHAGAYFFRISKEESQNLFMPNHKRVGPKTVARKIRALVNKTRSNTYH